ncbi:uncharacterized protein CCOS01_01873 [Colletotrichum costaricense]|uniref:Uncharacterized protein n=1 Tax=Colletotrichum costaricense TaxID=1209916 RepID=A0AAI9Z884_9PEZI|nr:uncharacterized protein CCOS01_01873 [Colletotrichum costaricense]KAK1536553.1 hypothetical protein CCOS01_01873 [Colletotrichum costaricense]
MRRTTQALRYGPLDMGIRCIHRRVDMLSFEGQNIALFQDETYVRSSSTSSSVLSKRCTTCQRSSNDVFRTRLRRSISPTRPRVSLFPQAFTFHHHNRLMPGAEISTIVQAPETDSQQNIVTTNVPISAFRPTASIILCTSQSQSPMPSTQPQSRPVYPIACRRRRRRRRLRADRMILIHPGAMEKPGPSSRFI